MPEWCPRCNTMLPEGLEKCPRCGNKLRSKDEENYTLRDIFNVSSQALVIILIPVILAVIIGLLCTILGN